MKSFFLYLKNLLDIWFDKLYFWHLKSYRKNDALITMEIIERFKEIEKRAYPEKLWSWQNQDNLDDVLNKYSCSCLEQIYYYIGENWYFVCADYRKKVRLLDFASAKGLCRDVLYIIDYIAIISKGREIVSLSRETTSYRLFRAVEKRKRIEFIMDKCYYIKGEFFHDISIKPNPKYYNRKKLAHCKMKLKQ